MIEIFVHIPYLHENFKSNIRIIEIYLAAKLILVLADFLFCGYLKQKYVAMYLQPSLLWKKQASI